MTTQRIHNFNAGPSALPLAVLEEMQKSLLNYKGSGMSVMEISHRSHWFDEILEDTIIRIRRLLDLGPEFDVLFIQGGASLQFAMVPMNFLGQGDSADFVDTGTWSSKAIAEAKIQNKTVRVVASSKDRNYCYIPKSMAFDPQAAFVHLTSNNTIKGTQWHGFPDTGQVPIITDMSSDILSRPMDMTGIGMIYAGAQKNIGPAGVALVIIRKDLLERIPETLPTMLSYKTFAQNNSMFNTPPCFTIYAIQLVMTWLEDTCGGLDAVGKVNGEKARLLYEVIDQSTDFYTGTADKDSRSLMNVTFRLPDEGLEKRFVEEALKHEMGGLKGHKSVGGCRASIYNATTLYSVSVLADFMKHFEAKHG
ncbi:MAG: 3-phosphoserine/phosphohydroxythreonine transaminase [Proteobacteria bacterium]|nr:3-phosphoserine/phosphohydroxythreonine transaminase [Pseudomonadota bacterium]